MLDRVVGEWAIDVAIHITSLALALPSFMHFLFSNLSLNLPSMSPLDNG